MPQRSPTTHFGALHEIRDRAYLLSLGNVYLCEDVFLRKIGNEIESLMERLKEEILSIKKRFPGQLASDVDMEAVLEDLRSRTAELKNPDPGLGDKCTAGELGRELEESIRSLTSAIKTLTAKVEGELPEYSKKDAVLDALSVAKTPASVISSTMASIFKGVIILLLLALGPLAYLFLTMERESSLMKEIAESGARISSVRERMSSLEKEREEIVQKIEKLRGDDAPRQDKISILDLNVQIHSLDDKLGKSEVEIADEEEKIKASEAKIENIKNKPFVQRLLKR